MTQEAPRPSRALLFLSAILITVGSCGTVTGLAEMQVDPFIPVGSGVDPEREAERQAQLRVVDAVLRSPYRKPIAAADAVVSMLLLWAGCALYRRRETALWWVSQAAFANGLVVVAEATTQWYAIDGRWEDILGPDPDIGLVAANVALSSLALVSVARVGLYVWVFWRVRRPDVRAALAEG